MPNLDDDNPRSNSPYPNTDVAQTIADEPAQPRPEAAPAAIQPKPASIPLISEHGQGGGYVTPHPTQPVAATNTSTNFISEHGQGGGSATPHPAQPQPATNTETNFFSEHGQGGGSAPPAATMPTPANTATNFFSEHGQGSGYEAPASPQPTSANMATMRSLAMADLRIAPQPEHGKAGYGPEDLHALLTNSIAGLHSLTGGIGALHGDHPAGFTGLTSPGVHLEPGEKGKMISVSVVSRISAVEIKAIADLPDSLLKGFVELIKHPNQLYKSALTYVIENYVLPPSHSSTAAAEAHKAIPKIVDILDNTSIGRMVERQEIDKALQKISEHVIASVESAALRQVVGAFLDDGAGLAAPFIGFINGALAVATIAAEIVEANKFENQWGYALNHPAGKAFYLDVDYAVRAGTVAAPLAAQAQTQQAIQTQTQIVSPPPNSILLGRGQVVAGELGPVAQKTSTEAIPVVTPAKIPVLDINAYIYYQLKPTDH